MAELFFSEYDLKFLLIHACYIPWVITLVWLLIKVVGKEEGAKMAEE